MSQSPTKDAASHPSSRPPSRPQQTSRPPSATHSPSRSSTPAIIRSSAAFLHHLHTDPSSHHITLAGPSKDSPIAAQGSPRSLSMGFEGTGSTQKGSRQSQSRGDTSPAGLGLSHVDKQAGSGSRRSRRPRPRSTSDPAKDVPLSAQRHDRAQASARTSGAEAETSGQSEDYTDESSMEEDELPLLAAEEGDGLSCLEEFAMEEAGQGVTEAMDMLSIAGIRPEPSESSPTASTSAGSLDDSSQMASRRSSESKRSTGSRGSSSSRLLGRAGTLAAGATGRSESPRQVPGVERLSWDKFSKSYAHGLFDPNRIPVPPRLRGLSTTGFSSGRTSPSKSIASAPPRGLSEPQPSFASESSQSVTASSAASGSSSATTLFSSGGTSSSASVGSMPPTVSASRSEKASMAAAIHSRRKAFELENISPTSSGQPEQSTSVLRPDKLTLPSYSLAAATVRMASSNLRPSDLQPLGTPSPERELTDPLASIVSPERPIPESRGSASSDPGSSRFPLSRSMSSAVSGYGHSTSLLPTIAASPMNTPNIEHSRQVGHKRAESQEKAKDPAGSKLAPPRTGGMPRIPAASVPLEKSSGQEAETDYFGAAAGSYVSPPAFDRTSSSVSQSSSGKTGSTATATPMGIGKPKSTSPEPAPPRPITPPAPAPEATTHSRATTTTTTTTVAALAPPVPSPSEMGAIFNENGWLPAPYPPNELARRKALYRYNILHTAPDVNFDRIAHMAKLVFSSKIVLIALVDAETQWHKSEAGLGAESANRITSFCSHSILSKTTEPFVVLDAKSDWRFANNPQVVGPPHIRFYAGAPLSTADGYHIGTLCIIDDKPREDFPPRSRLILKEFASIAMREMELWRDKLQLKVRDKIQTSMEKFTRECLEMDPGSEATSVEAASRMDKVYDRAAQLLCSTLDLEGAFILDLSQFEKMDLTLPTGQTTIYRADPYINESQSPVLERSDAFGPVNAFPILASTPSKVNTRPLTAVEHEKLSEFLRDNTDGRIFEGYAPSWLKYMLPPNVRFGLAVPVYGVNQQPFAMLCAYTRNKNKQSLEGYELQFLRAIGVIILSAVLRRRMVLADKAKSILISSVSHELRTPLHGILAAAELLSDTGLDANQMSFLKTVQTCGTSLIETVNHVLDFTKLSGGAQSSGSAMIKHSRVNLANLVESTVEGSWIGQRAKLVHGDSDIGSYYASDAPTSLLSKDARSAVISHFADVEVVIDIAQREKGWTVRCEKGGLRRVIMNLVGNSLKFTSEGYVQVTLRELPHPPGSKTIPVEIAVIDTGKGIGKEFLKDQLFHPFSQENPLQTGTGLGLAIVNSIVRSDAVNGKVDVWSSEGIGTEIRVSFDVEVVEEDDEMSSVSSVVSMASHPGQGRSISFFGFSDEHRGQLLSLELLATYAAVAGFELSDGVGDVLVLQGDEDILDEMSEEQRPVIFLANARSVHVNEIRENMLKGGRSLQVLYKPIGPGAFKRALAGAIDYIDERDGLGHGEPSPSASQARDGRPSISRESSGQSMESTSTISELTASKFVNFRGDRVPLVRRRSEETEAKKAAPPRPPMHARGVTYHAPSRNQQPISPRKLGPGSDDTPSSVHSSSSGQPGSPSSTLSTISLADGGVMLKAATVSASQQRVRRVPRVLIIEDNVINRRVLGAFLKKKGIEYAEAVNGAAGVEIFETSPPHHWDVILMDISMPVMNGHEATRAIRRIESSRSASPAEIPAFVPLKKTSPGTPASTGKVPSASSPGRPSPGAPASSSNLKLREVSSGSASTASASPPKGSPTPPTRSTVQHAVEPPAQLTRKPSHRTVQSRAKIFALTGLATSDDKREAFGSGVDGYLVKPVSLKSLGLIFQKIGFPIDI